MTRRRILRHKSTNIPTDYIAYWKFDNNLNDVKGHDLTGVLAQSYTNDRKGNPLSAYNSINSNWAYADSLNVDYSDSFSLSCWFFVDDSTPWVTNGYVGQWNDGGASPLDNRFRMSPLRGSFNNGAVFVVETTTGIKVVTSPNIFINEWVLITGVVNGTNMYLYENDNLVNTVVINGTILNISKRLYVNNEGDGGTESQASNNILFDDIRIFNRALKSSEIKSIYNE